MLHNDFELRIRTFESGMILDIKGEITKQSEEAILQLRDWEQGLGDNKSNLVMNFTDVSYVNSAGIAVLIRLVRHGIKAPFRTFAYGVNSHYQKLFRMVGLSEYMMMYPDEQTVLHRIEDLKS